MAQGRITERQSGIVDVKFDIALFLDRVRLFKQRMIDNPDWSDRNSDRLLHHVTREDILSAKVGVEVIGHVHDSILSANFLIQKKKLDTHLLLARTALGLQEEHLFSSCDAAFKDCLQDILASDIELFEKNLPEEVYRYYTWMSELQESMKIYKKTLSTNFNPAREDSQCWKFVSYYCDFSIVFSRSVIYLRIGKNGYLLSRDQFLMIHNKVFETFNVVFTTHCLSGSCWPRTFYNHVLQLLRFMITKVITLGNKSYAIFRTFDALATAVNMEQNDIFPNSEPLERLFQEMAHNMLVSHDDISLLKGIFNCGKHLAIELSGISKLMGHPDIDTPAGLKKLFDRTHKENPVSARKVQELINMIKLSFCERFFLRHGRWPILHLKERTSKRLTLAIFNNKWLNDRSIPSEFPPVTAEEFSAIDLGQNLTFDYIDSQMPILKDTALAPLRSVLDDPDLHKVRKWEDRRTLLYFLLTQHPDRYVRDHFLNMAKKDPLALEYLVIKLTQKEKELKEDGRMFGQSPYPERSRRCIMEFNIANYMELYNVNQAMTLNELQKFRKMQIIADLTSTEKESYVIHFSVDVEAFNNGFRNEFCEPVGREIFDKLFGEQIYSETMKVFEMSEYLCEDDINRYRYTGQLGGIEGLAQKFWTIIYDAVATRIAHKTGMKYYVMINGDDLRVTLVIPKAVVKLEDLKKLIDTISREFKDSYAEFGFKLKLEETYASSSLLGFGKNYIIDQIWCTTTLKKVAKCHGLANLPGDYPTEYMKGVMSEAISTMSFSVNHRFIYLLALINIQFYLTHFFFLAMRKLNENEKVCLLLFPSTFGGIPVLPYLRCLVKGDSDLETVWISFYSYIKKPYAPLFHILSLALSKSLKLATSYQGLASNPFGIPTRSPPDGMTSLQAKIRNSLPSLVQNLEFSAILSKATPLMIALFLQRLYSSSVIEAKAFSVIYGLSPAGQIDELVRKFTGARSAFNLFQKVFGYRKANSHLINSRNTDFQRVTYSLNTIRGNYSTSTLSHILTIMNQEKCPTAISDDLRSYLWGKPIRGITYPCIVDQMVGWKPQSRMLIPAVSFSQNRFTAVVSWPEPGTNLLYSRGNYKVFHGSHTKMKLTAPALEIKGSGPGMSKIIKILKVLPMISKLGKSMKDYLMMSLRELTGIHPDLFDSAIWGTTTGSIAHRIPANHFSPTVGPNEMPNRTSHFKSSSATYSSTKVISGDHTINYNYIFSIQMLLSTYICEVNPISDKKRDEVLWFRLAENCKYCINDVSDKELEWSLPPPDFSFGMSSNIYVGLSQNDRKKLVEELHLQQKLFSSRKNFIISFDGTDGTQEAFKVLAQHLLSELAEPFKDHLADSGHFTNLTEEELGSLYHQHMQDEVSLTDLKKLPVEVLVQFVEECFVEWVFNHLPEFLCQHSPSLLLSRSSNQLPFLRLCDAMYSSGYWPLLQEKLENELPGLRLHGSDQSSIQMQKSLVQALSRKLLEEHLLLTPIQPLQVQDLYVSYYPFSDRLLKVIERSILRCCWNVIRKWLRTADGITYRQWVRNRDWIKVIPIISFLRHLHPYKFTDFEDHQTKNFKLFEWKEETGPFWKPLHQVLGVPQAMFHSCLMDLQERGPCHNQPAFIIPLTMSMATLKLASLDKASAKVRATIHKAYEDLFQEGDPSVYPTTRIILKAQRRLPPVSQDWVDFEFTTLETKGLTETQSQMIHNADHLLLEHQFNEARLCDSFCLRLFGELSSGPCKLLDMLYDHIPLSRQTEGNILCGGDDQGGFSAACLKYFPLAQVIFNDKKDPGSLTSTWKPLDCKQLNSSQLQRLSLDYHTLAIRDLSDSNCTEYLSQDFCDKKFFLVTVDCQYHWSEPEESEKIFSNIIQLCKESLKEEGCLIYKVLWVRDQLVVPKLVQLAELFSNVRICKPQSSHDYQYEVYLLGMGFHGRMNINCLFSNRTLISLQQMNQSILFRISMAKKDRPTRSFSEYIELCKRYRRFFGTVDLTDLVKKFQSFSYVSMGHPGGFRSSLILMKEGIVREITNQSAWTKALLNRRRIPENQPLTQIRQHFRLLIEAHAIDYLIERLLSNLSFSDLYDNPGEIRSLMLKEALAKARTLGMSDTTIRAHLAADWIEHDHKQYLSSQIRSMFILWWNCYSTDQSL